MSEIIKFFIRLLIVPFLEAFREEIASKNIHKIIQDIPDHRVEEFIKSEMGEELTKMRLKISQLYGKLKTLEDRVNSHESSLVYVASRFPEFDRKLNILADRKKPETTTTGVMKFEE